MPHLRRLIERGVIGNLRPAGSAVPAIAWTSLITGRHADDHGVLSGLTVDPCTGVVRPASSTARRVKAVWNIAMQGSAQRSGLTPQVVAWCAGHPVEPLSGACVAEEFCVPQAPPGRPWPVPPQSVSPESLIPELAPLRFHGGELSGVDLRPFIPKLAEIDQQQDDRVIAVADTLARAIGVHAVATHLLEHHPWDLACIGWSALERACFRFVPYTAPRLPFVSEDDFAKYSAVVNGMYSFHDMMLGRIVQLAGPDAVIAIVSPSGFRVGGERPLHERWRQKPGAWIRPSGMFCFSGPGLRRDESIHGASVLDIAPTILALLGLPAAEDMPGRVLTEAFEGIVQKARVASWEKVAGDSGMHRFEDDAEHRAGAAAVAELEALGYREPEHYLANRLGVDREKTTNLTLVHLARGRYAEAQIGFEELAGTAAAGSPETRRFTLWAAHCALLARDHAGCRKILTKAGRAGPLGAIAMLIEAQMETDPVKILEAARRAQKLGAEISFVQFLCGMLCMRLKRWDEAEAPLRRAIAINPLFRPAHDLLARLLLVRGNTEDARRAAEAALQIDTGSAFAQFTLAMTLVASGEESLALQAFERAADSDAGPAESREWAEKLRFRRVESGDPEAQE